MAGHTMGMGDGYVSFADELDANDPVGGATPASFVNCDLVNSDAAHLVPIQRAVEAFTGECDDLEAQQGEDGPATQGLDPSTLDMDRLGPPVDLDQPAPAQGLELEQTPASPSFAVPTFNF